MCPWPGQVVGATGACCYQTRRPGRRCRGSVRQAARAAVGAIGGVGAGSGVEQMSSPGGKNAGMHGLGLIEMDRASTRIRDAATGLLDHEHGGGDVPVVRGQDR